MDNPVCLIENHEDGTLQVNQDALDILSRFTQKVVVVAIVGKYRTGKSFLMNMLAGRKNGFSLGSTVQSETKGIWIWCVPHPVKRAHTLVLLDTEGLGDVEKCSVSYPVSHIQGNGVQRRKRTNLDGKEIGKNSLFGHPLKVVEGNSQNDSWIFALTVLLSSTLVYNSMGTIDQQAVDQLHYVTELTEKIKVKSAEQQSDFEDESSEFKRFFPTFVWCVRDFTLDLNFNGENITEDEYLKNALKLKSGMSLAVRNYNLPRECILHYFHSHKCFVFDRPASKTDLQNLDNIKESQLDPAFVQQMKRFSEYIYEMSPVKTLSGGYTMTGRGLGDVAVSYVEAIRSGSIPSMENAVLALAKIENSRAVQGALSKYDQLMNDHASEFPTETQEEFLNFNKECHAEALEVFMKHSFKDEKQEYQAKLVEELEQKKSVYQQQNEQMSVRKCRALLQELSATMEKEISEGKFSVPGGYKLFTKEKKALEADYLKAKGKGVKSLEVLQEFLKEKENVESAIRSADKNLKEKEKKLAEQRSQAEAAAREKEILEKANMDLKNNMENEKENYKMHVEMLEKKRSEEREQVKQENERLITEKLKEQQEMLAAGFKKSEMLQERINRLQEENRKPTSIGEIVTDLLLGFLGKFVKKIIQ